MLLTKRVRTTWKEDPGPPDNLLFFNEAWAFIKCMFDEQKTDCVAVISSDRLTRWRCFVDDSAATEWMNFYLNLVNQSVDDIKLKFDSILIEDNENEFYLHSEEEGFLLKNTADR
jgi:hypothetical protein